MEATPNSAICGSTEIFHPVPFFYISAKGRPPRLASADTSIAVISTPAIATTPTQALLSVRPRSSNKPTTWAECARTQGVTGPGNYDLVVSPLGFFSS
jgi:hypothetical protein